MAKTIDEQTEIVLNLFNKGKIIPGEVHGVSMFDGSTDILVFFYLNANIRIYLYHTLGASQCFDNADAVIKYAVPIYNALLYNNLDTVS